MVTATSPILTVTTVKHVAVIRFARGADAKTELSQREKVLKGSLIV